MSLRILHFAPDEKFIPLIQDLYEIAFPNSNKFRILDTGADHRKYVNEGGETRRVGEDYFSSSKVKDDFEQVDCLILHSMLPCFATAVKSAPQRLYVVWSGWGYDYYGLLEPLLGPLVLPETNRLLWRIRRKSTFLRLSSPAYWATRVLNCSFGAKGRRQTGQRCFDAALHSGGALESVACRINLFSASPVEETMLRRALPTLQAPFHMLHYYTVEDTLQKGPEKMTGPDILVGNSATPSNNHIEIFKELQHVALDGRKVIVPLSYGEEDYAVGVVEAGKKLLGDAFVPLRAFMAIEDYNRQIASCGVVVMNHVRQQAVGNISAALYKGARVFLRRENPLFRFFCDNGATVFPMEQLVNALTNEVTGSAWCITQNKMAMEAMWARVHVTKSIRSLANLWSARGLPSGEYASEADARTV